MIFDVHSISQKRCRCSVCLFLIWVGNFQASHEISRQPLTIFHVANITPLVLDVETNQWKKKKLQPRYVGKKSGCTRGCRNHAHTKLPTNLFLNKEEKGKLSTKLPTNLFSTRKKRANFPPNPIISPEKLKCTYYKRTPFPFIFADPNTICL